jgi:hypothetical protein
MMSTTLHAVDVTTTATTIIINDINGSHGW